MGLISLCFCTLSRVFALSNSGTGLETRATFAVISHSHIETRSRTEILFVCFIHIMYKLLLHQAYCMEMRSTAFDKDKACHFSRLWEFYSNANTALDWDQGCFGLWSWWPVWILLIGDMLRQWQCEGAWPYTSQTLCIGKCYWSVYCHKSQTLQWPGPGPLIYLSIRTTLSNVLIHWALRRVALATGAWNLNRFTWLLISSVSLHRETLGWKGEMWRRRAIFWPWSSGLLVCPWHCQWDRSRECLLFLL